MPVYVRTDHGDLRLTLSNGDEMIDSQVAAIPQGVSRVAITMIAARDALDIGDTLTCRRDDVNGTSLPPPRTRNA
jgi:hypothetical protein